MKIKTIKFFNPVKVGRTQLTFIEPNSKANAEKNGFELRIDDGEGNITFSSIFNASYWTVYEEEKPSDKPAGDTSPPKSSGKKKSK